MARPVFEEFTTLERKRSYDFGDGVTTDVVGAERLSVSESGNHRLETADGKKHIVASGWIHITIDADDWSL